MFGFERDDSKPWLDDYAFRKRITITPNVATDLVDVPISVATVADPELRSRAQVDGTDLVFTADDDTLLDYEIVNYDPTSGALDAWVRIPALSGQASTELSLYYGGPSRASLPIATWPSTCAVVWHLSGTTATEHDSTTNAHHPFRCDRSGARDRHRGVRARPLADRQACGRFDGPRLRDRLVRLLDLGPDRPDGW